MLSSNINCSGSNATSSAVISSGNLSHDSQRMAMNSTALKSKRKNEDQQEFELRRLKRNMREQKRSLELSMQIQGLGDILTSLGAASKSDKFSVLAGTIQLITSLEQQCRQASGFAALEGSRGILNDKSMRTLLTNMPLPWALVGVNGAISACSYGFVKVFQIKNPDNMKMSVFDFIEPQHVTATYAAMMAWKNFEARPVHSHAEIRAVAKFARPADTAHPNVSLGEGMGSSSDQTISRCQDELSADLDGEGNTADDDEWSGDNFDDDDDDDDLDAAEQEFDQRGSSDGDGEQEGRGRGRGRGHGQGQGPRRRKLRGGCRYVDVESDNEQEQEQEQESEVYRKTASSDDGILGVASTPASAARSRVSLPAVSTIAAVAKGVDVSSSSSSSSNSSSSSSSSTGMLPSNKVTPRQSSDDQSDDPMAQDAPANATATGTANAAAESNTTKPSVRPSTKTFATFHQPSFFPPSRRGKYDIVLTPVLPDKIGMEVSFHLKLEISKANLNQQYSDFNNSISSSISSSSSSSSSGGGFLRNFELSHPSLGFGTNAAAAATAAGTEAGDGDEAMTATASALFSNVRPHEQPLLNPHFAHLHHFGVMQAPHSPGYPYPYPPVASAAANISHTIDTPELHHTRHSPVTATLEEGGPVQGHPEEQVQEMEERSWPLSSETDSSYAVLTQKLQQQQHALHEQQVLLHQQRQVHNKQHSHFQQQQRLHQIEQQHTETVMQNVLSQQLHHQQQLYHQQQHQQDMHAQMHTHAFMPTAAQAHGPPSMLPGANGDTESSFGTLSAPFMTHFPLPHAQQQPPSHLVSPHMEPFRHNSFETDAISELAALKHQPVTHSHNHTLNSNIYSHAPAHPPTHIQQLFDYRDREASAFEPMGAMFPLGPTSMPPAHLPPSHQQLPYPYPHLQEHPHQHPHLSLRLSPHGYSFSTLPLPHSVTTMGSGNTSASGSPDALLSEPSRKTGKMYVNTGFK